MEGQYPFPLNFAGPTNIQYGSTFLSIGGVMENWDVKEFGTDIRKVCYQQLKVLSHLYLNTYCMYHQYDPETDTWDLMPATLETPINAVGGILMDELEIECQMAHIDLVSDRMERTTFSFCLI